jgi:DNA-binding IclR family transcriptional regulator
MPLNPATYTPEPGSNAHRVMEFMSSLPSGPSSLKRIATYTGLTRAQVSSALNNLRRAGYVKQSGWTLTGKKKEILR